MAVVEEVKDDVGEQVDFASDADVDEVEALPPLSLRKARDFCIRPSLTLSRVPSLSL